MPAGEAEEDAFPKNFHEPEVYGEANPAGVGRRSLMTSPNSALEEWENLDRPIASPDLMHMMEAGEDLFETLPLTTTHGKSFPDRSKLELIIGAALKQAHLPSGSRQGQWRRRLDQSRLHGRNSSVRGGRS